MGPLSTMSSIRFNHRILWFDPCVVQPLLATMSASSDPAATVCRRRPNAHCMVSDVPPIILLDHGIIPEQNTLLPLELVLRLFRSCALSSSTSQRLSSSTSSQSRT